MSVFPAPPIPTNANTPRPARRDLPGFVQVGLRAVRAPTDAREIALPGTGEEAAGKVVSRAGAAEAGHGLVEFGLGL
jgi:hypothetical protein